MSEKIIKRGFVVIFFILIALPLLAVDLKGEKISEAENRRLASAPSLFNEDSTVNINFIEDVETWLNDNLGFRSNFVIQNAKIQYYLFGVLSNNSDMILGPRGEFNYAPEDIIKSYQHFDLKSEEDLEEICEGFQKAKDYLDSKGVQFYYYQCWDKQSIYPEHFPQSVLQYGDYSSSDQTVQALIERTTVNVISPKDLLTEKKKEYDTYCKWGDVSHWTQRGAYLGYQLLMAEINNHNKGKYRVLDENDFIITITDQGKTLFGGIHEEERLENFELKAPSAYQTDEPPLFLSSWAHKSRLIYRNDDVENTDTVLILGDSYFDEYIYEYLAESFHETIQVWGDYSPEFIKMIDYYNPSIVIVENAERSDRTNDFAAAILESFGMD